MPLPISGMRVAGEMPGIAEAAMGPGMMPGFGGMPGMMQGPSNDDQERRRQEALRQQMEQRKQQMMAARASQLEGPMNFSRPQPVNLDVDATESGIEKLGGTAVIDLDGNQRVRVGGAFMPGYQEDGVSVPSTYRIEAGYQTPGLNVNVNYRPRRRGGGMGPGGPGGFGGFGVEAGAKMSW